MENISDVVKYVGKNVIKAVVDVPVMGILGVGWTYTFMNVPFTLSDGTTEEFLKDSLSAMKPFYDFLKKEW